MNEARPTLLVVDDEAINIDVLIDAVGADYAIRVAVDGAAALASVRRKIPDLILLDVMMPGMDGFEVCRHLKEDPDLRDLPVIFLTALSDSADEARGLALGAVDYITKPISPPIVKARIRNHLELKAHRNRLEELVRMRTDELTQTQDAAIASMAFLAEYRDPETGAHIQRTKNYVCSLAKALAGEYPADLTPTHIDRLAQSAPLHDIGKVAIPDAILLKPGPLTSKEVAMMMRHTILGGEVLRRVEVFLGPNSFLKMAREIAECHHEHWDGTGYPQGLKGEEIPLSARLMAVADVYDALISVRPYKPPYSHERAFEVITCGDGRTRPEHFSPVVLEAFRQVHADWMLIAAKNLD